MNVVSVVRSLEQGKRTATATLLRPFGSYGACPQAFSTFFDPDVPSVTRSDVVRTEDIHVGDRKPSNMMTLPVHGFELCDNVDRIGIGPTIQL